MTSSEGHQRCVSGAMMPSTGTDIGIRQLETQQEIEYDRDNVIISSGQLRKLDDRASDAPLTRKKKVRAKPCNDGSD